MLENIIILLIFIGACGYLGNLFRQSFFSKSSCSKGCSNCGAKIDVDKIEAEIRKNGF